jgi:vacuolar protein sorting-associated protein 13A/C
LPGFFVGGLKGITGLLIKPVSGIVDATTKTAEGIKNTANFLSPN